MIIGIFSQYDQTYIAAACEKAGLINRALEHYSALDDVLRFVWCLFFIIH
jgi:hypothetical protein